MYSGTQLQTILLVVQSVEIPIAQVHEPNVDNLLKLVIECKNSNLFLLVRMCSLPLLHIDSKPTDHYSGAEVLH